MSDPSYVIVLTPLSDEDGGGYMAHVPDLPGCLADGEDPAAAVKDVLSAIGEWSDEVQEAGMVMPAPGTFVAAHRDEQEKLLKLIKAQKAAIRKHENLCQSQSKIIDELRAELVSSREVISELTEQLEAGDGVELAKLNPFEAWSHEPIAVVSQLVQAKRFSRIPG